MTAQPRPPTPLIGFSAFSGTGKTTLLTQLIPVLRQRGLRLAVIKHAHHAFDVDYPGKDSYELRKADACQVLISSARRKVLVTEMGDHPEATLEELFNELDHDRLDLVLVEGFKRERFNKIELHRAALNKPYLYPGDDAIIALATDSIDDSQRPVPVLDLNQPEQIADFIIDSVVNRQPAEIAS